MHESYVKSIFVGMILKQRYARLFHIVNNYQLKMNAIAFLLMNYLRYFSLKLIVIGQVMYVCKQQGFSENVRIEISKINYYVKRMDANGRMRFVKI